MYYLDNYMFYKKEKGSDYMVYREKKIYSGNMLEVEVYPITLKERKQTRRKKQRESLPKQKKVK